MVIAIVFKIVVMYFIKQLFFQFSYLFLSPFEILLHASIFLSWIGLFFKSFRFVNVTINDHEEDDDREKENHVATVGVGLKLLLETLAIVTHLWVKEDNVEALDHLDEKLVRVEVHSWLIQLLLFEQSVDVMVVNEESLCSGG
jgi:magnesium-transporting ATPase (P-type)